MDEEPVRAYHDRPAPKSVGNGMTFRRDISGEAEIRSGVMALCDSVAARLRDEDRKATVVQVQIKTPDFRTVQKQCTLKRATWLRVDLIANAMALIRAAVGYGTAIRALTVTASGLIPPGEAEEQLDIFAAANNTANKQEAVEDTLSQIRQKHGKQSISLGYFQNPDIGIDTHKKSHTKKD
jgi:DNA polymerase-4